MLYFFFVNICEVVRSRVMFRCFGDMVRNSLLYRFGVGVGVLGIVGVVGF